MSIATERRRLGRTALEVPVIGFGAASLGNLYRPVEDGEARAALAHAYAAGLRYVDTAPYYGFGLSERRVGDALRDHPRDSYVLSTKVGRLLVPDASVVDDRERHGFRSAMPFDPHYDYSYDAMMRSYEASLARLGLARIDIVLVHDIGDATHGEAGNAVHWRAFTDGGGYRALDALRASGAIGAIGLGVNEWQVCEAAMEIGQFDCFLLAGRYSLLEQGALESFFPACAAHGASVIAGGIYNSGILATGTRGAGIPTYDYTPAAPAILERVRAIENVCADHGVALPAAALHFVLAHPQIACAIPGMGNVRRIDDVLQHQQAAIPATFWADLKSAGLVDRRAPTPIA